MGVGALGKGARDAPKGDKRLASSTMAWQRVCGRGGGGDQRQAQSKSRVEPRAAVQLLSLSKLSRCMPPSALTA